MTGNELVIKVITAASVSYHEDGTLLTDPRDDGSHSFAEYALRINHTQHLQAACVKLAAFSYTGDALTL